MANSFTPKKVTTLEDFLKGIYDPAAHPDRAPLDADRTNEDRALDRFVGDMRRIAWRTPCGGSVHASSGFTTAEGMVDWFSAVVDEIAAFVERKRLDGLEHDRLRRDVEAMRRVLGIAPSAGDERMNESDLEDYMTETVPVRTPEEIKDHWHDGQRQAVSAFRAVTAPPDRRIVIDFVADSITTNWLLDMLSTLLGGHPDLCDAAVTMQPRTDDE